MKKREIYWTLSLLAVVLFPLPGMAANAAPVAVSLVAHKVVISADGKESLAAAREVKPGEVLEYQAVYSNQSKQPVRNVKAVLPIPTGAFSYIPASSSPASVSASLDGQKFEAVPLMRTVTLPDGKRVSSPVPVAEYRYLRWDLGDMKPGDRVTVAARMRMAGLEQQSTGGAK
jgi:uncharacterized repeat protein (TIGR01451 family)